ncbi:hypothetical protein SAMN02910456_01388 [Ruminococcaceae bacterium YRB3002]|nr:hypothetical protein SAMN02910456_01388 [Ruminococcaceae bacterium YRB3002]
MKRPGADKKMTAAKIIAGVTATLTLGCNINGCGVYGPPPTETTNYDPTTNENRTVYGPPGAETYDPTNNENEDVYGPPEDFYDPDDNNNADVYGPPEFLTTDVPDDAKD